MIRNTTPLLSSGASAMFVEVTLAGNTENSVKRPASPATERRYLSACGSGDQVSSAVPPLASRAKGPGELPHALRHLVRWRPQVQGDRPTRGLSSGAILGDHA